MMSLASCAQLFLTALRPESRAAWAAVEALPALLHELVIRSGSPWPGLALDAAVYLRFVAAHVDATPAAPRALGDLNGKDLFLACACLERLPAALLIFEADYLSHVDAPLKRIHHACYAFDDLKQEARQRILVGGSGTRPKLTEYGGRGALRIWLRVVAVRTALNVIERQVREDQLSDESWQRMPAAADPELSYFRQLYHAEFEWAVREAVTRLTAHERLLLQQFFIEGLSIDALGARHQVHRATVARWLARARARLVAEVRSLLMEKLRFSRSQLESALTLVRSDLHLRLSSIL